MSRSSPNWSLADLPVAFVVVKGDRVEVCSRAFAGLVKRSPSHVRGLHLHTLLPVVPAEGEATIVQVMVADRPGGLRCLVRASRLDAHRRGFSVEPLDPDADLFRRSFEHALVGMTQATVDGHLVRVNRAFCDLTGYAAHELLGRTFEEFTHPDDLEHERQLTQRVLDGHQPGHTLEKRLVVRDGRVIWVQHSLTLERSGSGKPDFLSVVVDITGRKTAEQALQRSTTQLKTAQRVARIGSWELDLTTRSLHWSDEIFRIFELEPGEFAASYEAFLERVHPEDRAWVDSAYAAAVRERTAYDLTHRLLMADGRVKHVREVAETFYGHHGKPLRSVGTVQDVTEQRSAELGLQDRELRLSTILSSIRDLVALFQLEPDAIRIVEINPTGLQRLRLFLPDITEDALRRLDFELLAKQLASRIPALGNLREALTTVLESGLTSELELESTPEPGVALLSELTLTPVPGKGGAHPQVLMVSHDVTARKKAERLLRASLAEKETLLSEVHHRVKNNLQIISSMLSLQSAEGVEPLTRELLEEARNRIHTMALVHEQLYRTRDFASIDLAEHIRSLAVMVAQAQARRDGVVLRCTLESVSVSLDQAIPLGLVLNELLSNAYKHAFLGRQAGTVDVSCAREGDCVRVQVVDDGVGLPAEQSLEGARSLGFRLVRTLVAQLGASLSIDRQHGTRLIIVVPAGRALSGAPAQGTRSR
ncbi:MAG: PAS domain S-box protein [Archangium sp.]|nr:PAS domain S-box protein [Archangium sp.]